MGRLVADSRAAESGAGSVGSVRSACTARTQAGYRYMAGAAGGGGTFPAPTPGRAREPAAAHPLPQADAVEEGIQLLAQFVPQIVRQATLAVPTVLPAIAAGDVQRLIHRHDDIGHADLIRIPRQQIPPARPARPHHQIAPTQHGKQLFKVRQGNSLIFCYAFQRNRTIRLMYGEINHRSNGITPFGA